MLFVLTFIYLLVALFLIHSIGKRKPVLRRKLSKAASDVPVTHIRNRKKPDWVVDKVIYLKALMPNCGCGTIAMTFNRLYNDKDETVSKTFVYEKLKANQYQVKCKRRDLRGRQPKATAINQTWGIDLTTVNINGQQKLILGIIDHGSRALLCLQALDTKHSLAILRKIIHTIKQYGFPKQIRSDNEHCFTSKLIALSLKSLSIKHQKTDVACPWQNGRIERCFGTFKQKWRQIVFDSTIQLQTQLSLYQTWYNLIRPHSSLDGRTPAEVFNNKQPSGKAKLITAWDGILTGYYFPD